MLRYTSGSKYPDLQSGSKDSWVRIPHAIRGSAWDGKVSEICPCRGSVDPNAKKIVKKSRHARFF